jgi:hypothetical protein
MSNVGPVRERGEQMHPIYTFTSYILMMGALVGVGDRGSLRSVGKGTVGLLGRHCVENSVSLRVQVPLLSRCTRTYPGTVVFAAAMAR